MSNTIEMYFSFRSPYSYLATNGALQICKDYEIDIALKPVLPIAIRDPAFFDPKNAYKVFYVLMDWERRAEMLGIPHAWPNPDPIVQDFSTGVVAKDQPYIYKLVMLGIEAEQRVAGLAFAAEVSRVIFGGTVNWHQGEHLANAAKRAGLDLADMEKSIKNPASHMAEVEKNQQEQIAAGHLGVPLFVYNGEIFFGQDRIETLRWRLDQDKVPKK